MSKWDKYYSADTPPPWDSGLPASQLVRFFENSELVLSKTLALELGCGTGHSTRYLAKQGFTKVIGVDISPLAIQAANSASAASDESKQATLFVEADILKLPCPADFQGSDGCILASSKPQCDFIFDCQCFHTFYSQEIEVRRQFLQVVSSNLKSGGLYFVMTGNSSEPALLNPGPITLSRDELIGSIMEGTSDSLELVSIEATRFDPTPVYEKLERLPLAWMALFRKK
jgi:SAM-dependent methyltransferase